MLDSTIPARFGPFLPSGLPWPVAHGCRACPRSAPNGREATSGRSSGGQSMVPRCHKSHGICRVKNADGPGREGEPDRQTGGQLSSSLCAGRTIVCQAAVRYKAQTRANCGFPVNVLSVALTMTHGHGRDREQRPGHIRMAASKAPRTQEVVPSGHQRMSSTSEPDRTSYLGGLN